MSEECIFCAIARKEAPASVVLEDDVCIAFLDIRPVNPGHTLVIPKKHCDTLMDCEPDIAHRMITMLQEVNTIVKNTVDSEGIMNFIANGEVAGQEVFHLHMHSIPRHRGDGFGIIFPPEYGKPVSRQELENLADRMRKSQLI